MNITCGLNLVKNALSGRLVDGWKRMQWGLASIFLLGLYCYWVGVNEKSTKNRGTYAQFFLGVDIVYFPANFKPPPPHHHNVSNNVSNNVSGLG